MKIDWLTTDETTLRTLGDRLKGLRIAAGFSQQRLAAACGVSVPVVGRMESGDGGVKFATWIAALRALGKMSNLEQFLPENSPTPYDYAERVGPKRKRAPRCDRKTSAGEWKWGE